MILSRIIRTKIAVIEIFRCETCEGTGTIYLGPDYDGPYYVKCKECKGEGEIIGTENLRKNYRYRFIIKNEL